MDNEFPADELWICPKFEQLELLNDPWLYSKGKNLMMVINSCTNAAQVDEERSVGTYTNATCANSTVIDDNIEEVGIEYKTITKHFDVDFYQEHQEQLVFVTNRGANSLFKAISKTTKFSVVENNIIFFKKKVIDLSTLTFLPEIFNWNIFNVDLEFEGNNLYASKWVNDPTWGYFNLIFTQSGKKNDIVWSVRTL